MRSERSSISYCCIFLSWFSISSSSRFFLSLMWLTSDRLKLNSNTLGSALITWSSLLRFFLTSFLSISQRSSMISLKFAFLLIKSIAIPLFLMTSESVNFGLALLGEPPPGDKASSSSSSLSFDLPYFFLDTYTDFYSFAVVAKSTCLGVGLLLLAVGAMIDFIGCNCSICC